jgi:hypothetical protein
MTAPWVTADADVVPHVSTPVGPIAAATPAAAAKAAVTSA